MYFWEHGIMWGIWLSCNNLDSTSGLVTNVIYYLEEIIFINDINPSIKYFGMQWWNVLYKNLISVLYSFFKPFIFFWCVQFHKKLARFLARCCGYIQSNPVLHVWTLLVAKQKYCKSKVVLGLFLTLR